MKFNSWVKVLDSGEEDNSIESQSSIIIIINNKVVVWFLGTYFLSADYVYIIFIGYNLKSFALLLCCNCWLLNNISYGSRYDYDMSSDQISHA
jgi:hypothetical protein